MSVVTALDALNTARLAWERAQPQYTIEGFWDGLDEREESRLGADASPGSDGALPLVEPEPGLSEPRRKSPGPEAAGEPAGLAEPRRYDGLAAETGAKASPKTAEPRSGGERVGGAFREGNERGTVSAASPSRLTPGAEPHRTPGDDLTAVASTVPPATPPSPSGGSAPSTPAEEAATDPAPTIGGACIVAASASAGTPHASNSGNTASPPKAKRGVPAEGV